MSDDDDWLTYYDERTHEWRCCCSFYYSYGNCRHLKGFRRIADVPVKEEYL